MYKKIVAATKDTLSNVLGIVQQVEIVLDILDYLINQSYQDDQNRVETICEVANFIRCYDSVDLEQLRYKPSLPWILGHLNQTVSDFCLSLNEIRKSTIFPESAGDKRIFRIVSLLKLYDEMPLQDSHASTLIELKSKEDADTFIESVIKINREGLSPEGNLLLDFLISKILHDEKDPTNFNSQSIGFCFSLEDFPFLLHSKCLESRRVVYKDGPGSFKKLRYLKVLEPLERVVELSADKHGLTQFFIKYLHKSNGDLRVHSRPTYTFKSVFKTSSEQKAVLLLMTVLAELNCITRVSLSPNSGSFHQVYQDFFKTRLSLSPNSGSFHRVYQDFLKKNKRKSIEKSLKKQEQGKVLKASSSAQPVVKQSDKKVLEASSFELNIPVDISIEIPVALPTLLPILPDSPKTLTSLQPQSREVSGHAAKRSDTLTVVPKYLGKATLPRPYLRPTSDVLNETHLLRRDNQQVIQFSSFNDYLSSRQFAYSEIDIETARFTAKWIRPRELDNDVTHIFVLAGRIAAPSTLFMPPKEEGINITLIVTKNEYDRLSPSDKKKDVSYLVMSRQGYFVEESGDALLRLVPCRRLAAFIVTRVQNINHFLLLDDNLFSINSKHQSLTVLSGKLRENNSFLTTLKGKDSTLEGTETHSHGSKVWHINYEFLEKTPEDVDSWALWFPPDWRAPLEDLYFYFMNEIVNGVGGSGLDREVASWVKSRQGQNSALKSIDGAVPGKYWYDGGPIAIKTTIAAFVTEFSREVSGEWNGWCAYAAEKLKGTITFSQKKYDANLDRLLNVSIFRTTKRLQCGQQEISTSVDLLKRFAPIMGEEAFDRCKEFIENNVRDYRAGQVVAPTGTGKTFVILAVIRHMVEKGKKILFITPQIDLIEQMFSNIDQFFPQELKQRIITISSKNQDGHYPEWYLQNNNVSFQQEGALVVLACLNSAQKFSKNVMQQYSLIIRDEAHVGKDSIDIEQPMDFNVPVLGFTATPQSKGEQKYKLIYEISREACAINGLIKPFTVDQVPEGTNLTDLVTEITSQHQQEDSCRGIIFASSIEQADNFRTLLQQNTKLTIFNVNTESLEKIEEFKSSVEKFPILILVKQYSVGANLGVFSYGIDCRGFEENKASCIQRLGRAVRVGEANRLFPRAINSIHDILAICKEGTASGSMYRENLTSALQSLNYFHKKLHAAYGEKYPQILDLAIYERFNQDSLAVLKKDYELLLDLVKTVNLPVKYYLLSVNKNVVSVKRKACESEEERIFGATLPRVLPLVCVHNAPIVELVTEETVGDGNCAFHSIFGKVDDQKGYFDKDAPDRRTEIFTRHIQEVWAKRDSMELNESEQTIINQIRMIFQDFLVSQINQLPRFVESWSALNSFRNNQDINLNVEDTITKLIEEYGRIMAHRTENNRPLYLNQNEFRIVAECAKLFYGITQDIHLYSSIDSSRPAHINDNAIYVCQGQDHFERAVVWERESIV